MALLSQSAISLSSPLFHIPYNQLHITAFKTGSETVNVSTGAVQVLSDSSKPAGPVTIP